MDYGKEFKKFATKEHGISSTYYDKIVSSMSPMGLTPNIIGRTTDEYCDF